MSISVKVGIYDGCNHVCDYCDEAKLLNAFPPIDKVQEFCDFLEDNSKEYQISFEGNEPMMRLDLCLSLMNRGCPIILFTNGTLITKDVLTAIPRNVEFRVSLDGTERLHNRHRIMKNGGNSFKEAMEGINLLVKDNRPFTIATTVTDETLAIMNELGEFFKTIPANRFVLTCCMFDDDNGIHTQAIYDAAAPSVKEWGIKNLTLYSYGKREPKAKAEMEILFNPHRVEVHREGYATPNLKTFSYDEYELKEVRQYFI